MGFINKGAELMLHAIMEKVKEAYPDVVFAIEINKGSPAKKAWALGIKTKADVSIYWIPMVRIVGFLPKRLRLKLGWVLEEEIDVILDGSGFNFGDKWGAKRAGNRIADHLLRWRSHGKKVILLPQAFGPFTQLDLIEKMKIIVSEADLIFARDRKSFDYLQPLISSGTKKNVFLAPDFTNLIAPVFPERRQKFGSMLAIIPNQKMRETEDEELNQEYPEFLKNLIELAIEKGQVPFFLIHESKADRAIAVMVNNQLSKPIPIIEEENPLVVKGIIGSCYGVISSRFHGLVSALSQAIPCLATGWSHKYEMLFEDYEFSEGLCQLQQKKSYYEKKLNLIVDKASRKQIIEKLGLQSAAQKKLSQEMWKMVLEKFEE